jgi:hypothetical protein
MWDVSIAEVAGRQFNRVSRAQLEAIGLSEKAIAHRVAGGRLVLVEQGVFAIAPVLDHDPWGRWMGATLTAPHSYLSHGSSSTAWEFLDVREPFVTITRPGSGGPRRHGGVLSYRSATLAGETTTLNAVPITTVPRTLVDLSGRISERRIARAVREAVRLELTTIYEIADAIGRPRGRRRTRPLAYTIARYTGLPIERARSGAEVRALEVLQHAGRPMPRLNVKIAGEEADLSWARLRLIVEIDGGPFHLDAGEDARKQACWESAGWTVRRTDASDVYNKPRQLLDLAP